MRSRALAAAAASTISLLSASARAEEATVDRDEAARVARLEEALARDASASRTWFIAWVSVYGAATAAQSTLAVTLDDRGLRADAMVGAVKSGLGWLSLVVAPPPSLKPLPHLDEVVAYQKLRHSWLAHTAVVVVNVAAGGVLWLAYSRPVTGAVSTALGVAIGELQIWTSPVIRF